MQELDDEADKREKKRQKQKMRSRAVIDEQAVERKGYVLYGVYPGNGVKRRERLRGTTTIDMQLRIANDKHR
jgi:hypothetical protein